MVGTRTTVTPIRCRASRCRDLSILTTGRRAGVRVNEPQRTPPRRESFPTRSQSNRRGAVGLAES